MKDGEQDALFQGLIALYLEKKCNHLMIKLVNILLFKNHILLFLKSGGTFVGLINFF